MKSPASKLLGLAAMALALVGSAAVSLALIGFVFSGVAPAGGAGCEAYKASKASASASGCAAHKSSAALAGSDGCTAARSASFASNCERLQACSVDLKMERATAGDLDFYYKEKAMDGVALENTKLPVFYATSLNGKKVSSKDLRGRPTVLVLLATHCGHSYQSLPILTAAADEYGPKGVRVVGLVVGSSTDKAKKWFGDEISGHEVWVTSDVTVADKLKSHLVPTYLLVDANGNVKTMLVGFKKDTEVKESIPVLLVQSGGPESGKG
jgi:thiol-disulfide isomerase/thioredoxin